MGTYNIPRDTKGEGKLFYIFSKKAIIYTTVGLALGAISIYLFGKIKVPAIGWVITVIFSLLGFAIGTFKIPETDAFEITRKAHGLYLDEVIVRYVRFKMKKNKLYIYDREETK